MTDYGVPTDSAPGTACHVPVTAAMQPLAKALHVPPNRIYQIINGTRAMTADTALRLSQWLGTSAEMWMNLQKMYELRLAEQQTGDEIKRTVKRLRSSHHKTSA